jgi:hypothetical protein
MTYSNTQTRSLTETFTIADAKYLASRIAHGLTLLRLYCGQLTSQKVQDLVLEASILMKFGLLDNVRYGYQKNEDWVYALGYSVNDLGQVVASNDEPSIFDLPTNLNEAEWHSFLTRRYNPSLNTEDLAKIEQLLPIKRSSGTEPGSSNGNWTTDDAYYRNGVGLKRQQFRSY